MQITNIEQGTQKWLDLRKKYITSTLVAKIMTNFDLSVKEKELGEKNTTPQWVFDAGHTSEANARTANYEPCIFIKNDIMSSVDGYCEIINEVWEHKLFNAKEVEKIKKLGKVSDKYKWQLVCHQYTSQCDNVLLHFSDENNSFKIDFQATAADFELMQINIDKYKKAIYTPPKTAPVIPNKSIQAIKDTVATIDFNSNDIDYLNQCRLTLTNFEKNLKATRVETELDIALKTLASNRLKLDKICKEYKSKEIINIINSYKLPLAFAADVHLAIKGMRSRALIEAKIRETADKWQAPILPISIDQHNYKELAKFEKFKYNLEKSSRSIEQNKLLWAINTDLANELNDVGNNYTPLQIHAILTTQLSNDIVNIDREVIIVPIATSKLNTKQFTDYITNAKIYSFNKLGVDLDLNKYDFEVIK